MTTKERQCIQAVSDLRIKNARWLITKWWAVISKLKKMISAGKLPETKTIAALWALQGIERANYGERKATDLLNQWLDILYGKGTADRLDFNSLCAQKGLRYAQANIPYYTEEGAPHFYFGNPFDNTIEQISRELPPYL